MRQVILGSHMQNHPYNLGPLTAERTAMPKKKSETHTGFGARLAQLRKAAGYTQRELAEEVGTTQRMMAYYESPDALPPVNLLPQLAKVLGITTDALLGHAPAKKNVKPRNTRLQRRLQQIEQLDQNKKRQVLQFIDTIIESEKLKKKASG